MVYINIVYIFHNIISVLLILILFCIIIKLFHRTHLNLYLFAIAMGLNTKVLFTFHVRTSMKNLYDGNLESFLSKN